MSTIRPERDVIDNAGEAVRLAESIVTVTSELIETPLERYQYEALCHVHAAAIQLRDWLESDDEEESAHVAAAVLPSGPPDPSRLHILLVEDNHFTRLLMVRLLERHNYRVTVVGNGQEMLALLQQHPDHDFDLALVDLAMPVMDGISTAHEIRMAEQSRGWHHLPMIAVTALIGEENRQRVLDAGMDGFHGKPIQADRLFAEIERVLAEVGQRVDPSEIDLDRILRTVEGDWELLDEVLALYFTDAPRHVAAIEQAIAVADTLTLREVAHSLKGASGLFGQSSRVYELAYALERLGRDGGEMVQAHKLYKALQWELEQLQQTLQGILAQRREPV
ncbi:MAG: response regulator [Magnetococcales bacterium]|nr:response regulator [Magnetococcales bacterium]